MNEWRPLPDHIHLRPAVVTTSGQVVERYAYDPYGTPSFYSPSWVTRSSSLFALLYLHQGGRFDATSGLYNFRNRDFSPTLGRWMQEDPYGFQAGDTNLYRYEQNDPPVYTDPSGLIGLFIDGAGQRIGKKTSINELHKSYKEDKKYVEVPLIGREREVYDAPRKEADNAILAALKKNAEDKNCPVLPIDLFGWSRGAVVALGVLDDLKKTAQEYKDKGLAVPFEVRFVGLIDPVATGVPHAPKTVPALVKNFWVGYKDGKVAEPLWVPRGTFDTWTVTVEDKMATKVLGAAAPYHLNHVDSGFDGKLRDDFRKAAEKAKVPI